MDIALNKRIRSNLERIGVYAVVLVLWEIAVDYFNFGNRLFPAPTAIGDQLAINFISHYNIAYSTLVTLEEVFLGFGLAFIAGLGIALLIASSNWIRGVVYPVLLWFQSIPKTSIAPLLILWFGHEILSKIMLVFFMSFFPIIVNGTLGLSSVEPELIDLMRIMRTPTRKIFTKVRIPNAMPNIFAAIHIAIPLAVIGAVVGEFMAANAGLGWVILHSTYDLEVALTFAVLIFLAFIAYLLDLIIEYGENRIIPWHVTKRRKSN